MHNIGKVPSPPIYLSTFKNHAVQTTSLFSNLPALLHSPFLSLSITLIWNSCFLNIRSHFIHIPYALIWNLSKFYTKFISILYSRPLKFLKWKCHISLTLFHLFSSRFHPGSWLSSFPALCPLVWHVILLFLFLFAVCFRSSPLSPSPCSSLYLSLSLCRTPNVSSNGNPGYENLPLSDRQSPPPSVSSLVFVTSLQSVAFSWFIVLRVKQTDRQITDRMTNRRSKIFECFCSPKLHLFNQQSSKKR